MNIVIFDTETTSIDKPFCYNIGYVIANDKGDIMLTRDYVVEQIWHNLPLFSTAYYASKRPIYVQAMRKKETKMNKFGYVCQQMIRDFKSYNVECAYAYNSPFDDKVFQFNCDWFKCKNPFDTIPIFDIRGNAHHFLVDDDYKKFCEDNNLFTESGCYSSTAEAVYRYLLNNTEWKEDHTALSDSVIEGKILFETVNRGAVLGTSYTPQRSLGSPDIEKTLHIKTAEQTDYYFDYKSLRINKQKTEITLKA